jgi:RHS repeat-associated protein
VQQLLYNDANAQISSYDAMHNRTQFLYDKNMRQSGTIDGEGNTSSQTYDVRGNVSSKTDGRGNTTTYQYDGDNHLINVTDALGNNTYYTYDVMGNLLSQTDGSGNSTTYQYNTRNLKVAKIDPLGNGNSTKTETYTYYPNGLMAAKTDRNGVVTEYEYDIFGRLINENAGGEIQSYSYDANGNMLTMSDNTGITERTYDALNRNVTKTVPFIGKAIYEYDLPSEKAGEYTERTTDPKGNVTVKAYDKMGRLSKVTVGEDTTNYDYYPNGNRYSVTYPDGTDEIYTYDKNNHVTSLVNKKVDGAVISSFNYTYDEAGNQLTKTENKGTTTYTYDTLNRLSTVTEPDGKETSYTYDGAGNRKSEQVKIGSAYAATIYTYNNQNRLTKTISSNGVETKYIYDYNGNLINKTINTITAKDFEELTAEDLASFDLIIKRQNENGTGTKEITYYSYDHYNRLIETKSENTTSTYGYNAQGYRVEKKVNNETTRYFYEADKVVLETGENNNQKALQVYGSNLLYRSTAADSELGAQSYYYLYNAHGDVTELIDAQGIIAATYDYDAFGNIISNTGNADNSITYAGYQYDKESGLYYLNARYYDSVTARFITEDTYRGEQNDPLSLNLYTYCVNNPIIYTDPTGHVAGSLVDYLDEHDMNSTYAVRKNMANAMGIKNYKGTADQNTQILNNLKASEAAKEKAAKEKAAKEKAAKDEIVTENKKSNRINFDAKLPQIIDGSNYKKVQSTEARETLFALNHPIAALNIGSVVVGVGSNNISTVAVRFATNYLGLEDNVIKEGTQVNAFRHALWQSIISNQYGTSTALEAGNAHEEHPDALNSIKDYNNVYYTNLSLADEACDLLNNQIGRKIGQEYNSYSTLVVLPGVTSMKTLAIDTLNYYYECGLWVAVQELNGLYSIKQEKLSEEQYVKAYLRLITLDDNGYGPENKKYKGGKK